MDTNTATTASNIPQHSSESNEQYTPKEYVEAAREVLGIIDLDPASSQMAQQTVQAKNWFGKEPDRSDERWIGPDGLSAIWLGNVFLNPPGGRSEKGEASQSSAASWWIRLAKAWEVGNVPAAIFVGFTLEVLRSTQSGPLSALRFPICVPKSRIAFDTVNHYRMVKNKRTGLREMQLVDPSQPEGVRVSGSSPTHANVIVYLPPGNTARQSVQQRLRPSPGKFGEVFKQFGEVI